MIYYIQIKDKQMSCPPKVSKNFINSLKIYLIVFDSFLLSITKPYTVNK